MNRKTLYLVSCGWSLLCAAEAEAQTVDIRPAPAFSGAELVAPPTDGWVANGGNVLDQRYSPLKQINRANDVFALDVDTGAILWTYQGRPDPQAGSFISRSSRGVAIGDGKVFVGLIDARLMTEGWNQD